MSTAHLHGEEPTDKHWAELARIQTQPWFQKGLAIPKTLVRTSQIPWLGGSSTDLRRIYIDPRFAGYAQYGARHKINVRVFLPAVTLHELVEGILLVFGTDDKGKPYDYDGAHEIATAVESLRARRILASLGLPFAFAPYNEIYRPFWQLMQKPPWENLPPDLNTEPYRQDAPGLYREMERQVLKDQVRGAA